MIPQGIFATHLHQLLSMQLDAPSLLRMRMETLDDGRYIRATMRMLPGSCTASLALPVAAACRVPENVIRRAEAHYQARLCRLSSCHLSALGQERLCVQQWVIRCWALAYRSLGCLIYPHVFSLATRKLSLHDRCDGTPFSKSLGPVDCSQASVCSVGSCGMPCTNCFTCALYAGTR